METTYVVKNQKDNYKAIKGLSRKTNKEKN
jgi:hypothetical protein